LADRSPVLGDRDDQDRLGFSEIWLQSTAVLKRRFSLKVRVEKNHKSAMYALGH
jgi:hypothetical protein